MKTVLQVLGVVLAVSAIVTAYVAIWFATGILFERLTLTVILSGFLSMLSFGIASDLYG